MTRTRLLALALASMLVLGAVGPAVAADGAALQTAGNEDDGEMEDDDDGNESDNSTDGNVTTPFGQQLQDYISSLENGSSNDSDAPRGILIATWVVANNPGNAPDHAGPPAWAGPGGNDSDNETRRGPPGDKRQGPPEDTERGPPEDTERGPPSDVGPSDDGDDEESEGTTDDGEETDDDDNDDGGNNGNGGGPPGNAGGGPPGR